MVVLEVRVYIAGPIELVNDEIKILVLALGHVFDQQTPRHFAAFDEILIHAEHITAPLWFIGAQTAWSMQYARRNQPAGSGFESVSLGEVKDTVVAFVPILQTPANLRFGGAGLEAHKGVGEIIAYVVMLWRKVVAFRFALLAHQLGLLGILVHVVWNGTHIVEELRVHRPLAVFIPDTFADDVHAAFGYCLAQCEPVAPVHHVAQALVGDTTLIGRLGGRSKPALVNAAAVEAIGIGVIRVQL